MSSALTPTRIRALLDEFELTPNRALGQNFLADPNTARRIVGLAGVAPGTRVLEIGAGIGSLTTALLDAGADVTAVERDRHVIPALRAVVGDRARIEVGDALQLDFTALLDSGPWICVSNLPYNVATPVVIRVLEEVPAVDRLLVMVQREVGERLAATPGGRDYGAVSLKVAYYGAAELVGRVSPTVFLPVPKVESALVQITRHSEPPVTVSDVDQLFVLVRAGFATRRKMLRRALRTELGDHTDEILARAGIDPRARAEALGLDEWAAIARAAA
jgi:16S rRNA (adenine1518-N6/adenine1519-N6)-dimethyltransferase